MQKPRRAQARRGHLLDKSEICLAAANKIPLRFAGQTVRVGRMKFPLVFLLGVLGMVSVGCESAPAAADDARQTTPAKHGDHNHRYMPRHRHCMQHDHH